MIDENVLRRVFGEVNSSGVFYKMITEDLSNNKNEYTYLNSETFLKMAEQNGIAWVNEYLANETLQRLYFATITGYLRGYRWVDGICNGINSNNYIIFSASLRGFLESVTDYYDALHNLPLTLAEQYKLLNKAVKGEVNDIIISFKEIEEVLIHFQEASKNSEYSDALYNPKTAKLYMENEHLKHLNLYKCYGELCEVTHPAKNSLDLFIDENNFHYSFNNEKDKILIDEFLIKHSDKFSDLFMRFENICIIILQLLNMFKIDKFYSKSVDLINTDKIKIWEKINMYVK